MVIVENLPVERLAPEARSAEEPNGRPGTRQRRDEPPGGTKVPTLMPSWASDHPCYPIGSIKLLCSSFAFRGWRGLRSGSPNFLPWVLPNE